jgi:hypothetical protein
MQFGWAAGRSSQQAPQRAAIEYLACITERLESRVKGLTAVFCVLLLTMLSPTRLPAGFCGTPQLRQNVFGRRRTHELLKR